MHRFWVPAIAPLLEAIQPQSILEIGSDRGSNTRNLLEFCLKTDAKLYVVDPLPKYDVSEWKEEYGEHVVFQVALSLNAIPQIDGFDAVLIDGDHNWYTVFNELKLIEKRCKDTSQPFPLVMLHDIGWPYGRRDLYYDPENIPETYRKPYKKKGLHPDSAELLEKGGINQHLCNAIYENNLQNGVLTAVEDFMEESAHQLELTQIPGLHRLGILIPGQLKEQNKELAKLLKSLDFPPATVRYLEQVEKDRLHRLVGLQEERDARIRELQEERARIRELQEERDAQIRELQEERDAQIRELQEERDARIRELQAKSREVDRLAHWVRELDSRVSALLNSRRWKAGNGLADLPRKALLKSPVPTVADSIKETIEQFRSWEKGHRDAKKDSLAHQPRKSASGNNRR